MSDHTKQEKSVSIEITFIIFLIFIGFFFQKLALNKLRQAMFAYEYYQVKDWKTVKLSDSILELRYKNTGVNAHKETPTLTIYDPQRKKYVIKKQYSYLQAHLIYDQKSPYPLSPNTIYKLDHALFMTSQQKSVVDPTQPILLFMQGELLLEDGNVLKTQANESLPSSKAKVTIQLRQQLLFFFIPTGVLLAILFISLGFYYNFKENGVNIICFAIIGSALFYIGWISISKVIIPWIHLT